ncbi:MAG: D-alanyl-D-alanine carboxypeptidase/D-alanyl-D-alanine-endopeptidase [Enhygromyxa sp.]
MVRRLLPAARRPLALGFACCLGLSAALALGLGAEASPPESTTNHSQPSPSLDAQIDALIAKAELGKHAKIGVSVVDLATGETLYARNAELALNPASNAKLLTTAAALERLGPEYRFATRIWTDKGGVEDGVVTGKLYLQGGGDPSLVTGEIFELVGQLRAAGVERVRGGVVVDAGRFDADGLPPGFDQKDEFASHRAPGGAMSVNYNTFEVHARPGKAIGDPPTLMVDPPVPSISVVSEAKTVAGNRNRLTVASKQEGGKIIVTFKGELGINNGASSYRYPIADPSRYAGELLVLAMAQRGIKVDKPAITTGGSVPRDAKQLAVYRSESLSELCRSVNKWSNNFMAEQILRALVPDDGATAAASLERLRAYTVDIGIPQDGLVVGNGSGLYANNMISPAGLTHLLAHVYADFRFRSDFIASLAIMGGDGTTRSRLANSPAEGWVRVKTGTLDDVSALSGYAGATGRDPIAFSILLNGLERKHRAKARGLQDQIAELLALEAARAAAN